VDGSLRVASCTQTGVFADLKLCSDILPVNAVEGFDLSFAQDGERVNARMFFGEGGDQTVAVPIAGDGSASFAGSASYRDESITLTIDTAWQVNSTQVGALAGRVTDVLRVEGQRGEGRVTYDVVSARRVSTSATLQRSGNGQASSRGQRLSRRLHR
jgi:hypothetical protein